MQHRRDQELCIRVLRIVHDLVSQPSLNDLAPAHHDRHVHSSGLGAHGTGQRRHLDANGENRVHSTWEIGVVF
jgi:hypothetical protein